jgi:hypothetical protein
VYEYCLLGPLTLIVRMIFTLVPAIRFLIALICCRCRDDIELHSCLISGTGARALAQLPLEAQCQEYYWTSVSHLQSVRLVQHTEILHLVASSATSFHLLGKEIPRVAYVWSLELPWTM